MEGTTQAMMEREEQVSTTSASSLGKGTGGLETFLKFKIMNANAAQIKKIFLKYVFVGSNLFSTSDITEAVAIEAKGVSFIKNYTIVIEKVGEFLLDDLNSMKMEDHPVALNFINSIIKSCLRNSSLK